MMDMLLSLVESLNCGVESIGKTAFDSIDDKTNRRYQLLIRKFDSLNELNRQALLPLDVRLQYGATWPFPALPARYVSDDMAVRCLGTDQQDWWSNKLVRSDSAPAASAVLQRPATLGRNFGL